MSHYPKEFPAQEAQHLYEMASTGTLRDNIPHALHDTWWLTGYLAKFTVGEPENHEQFGSSSYANLEVSVDAATNALVPAQKEQLAKLACLQNLDVVDLTPPGADPEGILDNIDINTLFQRIQQIIQMLQLLKLI
jgi:hypothetical protein